MKKKKSSKKSTSKNLVSSRNIIIALVVVILAIAVFNMGPSNKEEGLGQGGPDFYADSVIGILSKV